jgi:8-oxo-dGTP pyrophosphatase MutT (NUDIX family)
MSNELSCSVTVIPIDENQDLKVGFIRRDPGDTFGGLLVAPGGKVQDTDGELIDGVMYYSVEQAAIREFLEETGITLYENQLSYFCSLSLKNGRIVLSFCAYLHPDQYSDKLIFLTHGEVEGREDFAPGMKQEVLSLIRSLGIDIF